MDSKKRLMFSLQEDYYYITLKLLLILSCYDCYSKPFVDYRKLSILFEIVKDDSTSRFMQRISNDDFSSIDLFDNDRILDVVCNSKLNTPVIKRILLFLETKGIIELIKGNNTIDVTLVKDSEILELLDDENFAEDRERILAIKKSVPRARYIKFTTLKEKLFGKSEVIKWDD